MNAEKAQEPTKEKTGNAKKERNSLSLMASSEKEKKTGNTQKKEVFEKKLTENFQKNTRREEVWRSGEGATRSGEPGNGASCAVTPGREKDCDVPQAEYSKSALRHSLLTHYVEHLWHTVASTLYDPKILTKRQACIGRNLLYQWYESVAEDKLAYVHKVYLKRVQLVQKYLQKDPEHRYVQLPYRYFDPKNPNGFAGTMPWYKAEKSYEKHRNLQKIVRDQIRKFSKNEQLDTALARPRLTVFRECEQRISKLGIPKLLEQFYAAILQPKSSSL